MFLAMQTLPIMLALCLMLLATYYAQNYAGIIDLYYTGSCDTQDTDISRYKYEQLLYIH